MTESKVDHRLSFSRAELDAIRGIARNDGTVKLDDWFVNGIPADDFSGVGGSFTVSPTAIDDVVRSLLRNPKLHLGIFPLGIVAPDRYRVDFRSKGF